MFRAFEGCAGITAYQVIAVPEDKKIWVRDPGYNDWTLVDLRSIFLDN